MIHVTYQQKNSYQLNCLIVFLFLLCNFSGANDGVKTRFIPGSDVLVARVIFAEGSNVTTFERIAIASVIKNRIQHVGFNNGKHQTMREVVSHPGQFTCIDDDRNKQWERSQNPLIFHGRELLAWNESVILSKGDFQPVPNIVFYHDKSIQMPLSWKNNRFWIYEVAFETSFFVFYKIREK